MSCLSTASGRAQPLLSWVLLGGALFLLGCTKSSESAEPSQLAESGELLEYPLGIATSEADFMELVPAGTPLPHLYSKVFSTSEDGQKAVQITLGQKKPEGVETICELVVDGIPEAKKAEPRLVLTAEVDADRLLRVKTTVSETAVTKEHGPYPLAEVPEPEQKEEDTSTEASAEVGAAADTAPDTATGGESPAPEGAEAAPSEETNPEDGGGD